MTVLSKAERDMMERLVNRKGDGVMPRMWRQTCSRLVQRGFLIRQPFAPNGYDHAPTDQGRASLADANPKDNHV